MIECADTTTDANGKCTDPDCCAMEKCPTSHCGNRVFVQRCVDPEIPLCHECQHNNDMGETE